MIEQGELSKTFATFPGYVYNREASQAIDQGRQKKHLWSGMYTDVRSKKVKYIKQSRLADDCAEILFSMRAFSNVARCEPTPARNGEFFVASPKFDGFEALIPKRKRGIWKRMLGANPLTEKNKKYIHKKRLNTDQLKQDAANILADCFLEGDEDCTGFNLCRFTERVLVNGAWVETRHVGKIDHGWSYANLCAPGNQVLNLFGKLSPLGKKATHGFGGVPTNHRNDFPYLINSHFFIKAMALKIQHSTPERIREDLTRGFHAILSNCKEENKIAALHQIAEHIKLPIPESKTTVNDLKGFIIDRMTSRLVDRSQSMALIKALMQIKLCVDENNKRLSPKARILALKEVIEKEFKGRDIQAIMPPFEPSVDKLLADLIKEAKQAHVDPSLIQFCKEIHAGRNPCTFKRYSRHELLQSKQREQLQRQLQVQTSQAPETKNTTVKKPAIEVMVAQQQEEPYAEVLRQLEEKYGLRQRSSSMQGIVPSLVTSGVEKTQVPPRPSQKPKDMLKLFAALQQPSSPKLCQKPQNMLKQFAMMQEQSQEQQMGMGKGRKGVQEELQGLKQLSLSQRNRLRYTGKT